MEPQPQHVLISNIDRQVNPAMLNQQTDEQKQRAAQAKKDMASLSKTNQSLVAQLSRKKKDDNQGASSVLRGGRGKVKTKKAFGQKKRESKTAVKVTNNMHSESRTTKNRPTRRTTKSKQQAGAKR